MAIKPFRVGIVAGEASGDILAAGLISELKKLHPDAEFVGIGGTQMQAQGMKSLYNMEELSVMGLVEVLSRIRRLLFIRKSLVQHFLADPPDVFIGVDAPDFNLGLEMRLKANDVKTVHYVSPTIWAWREKRIFKIAKATNMVLSIFPFEKAYYDKYQFPCRYVGHTLADSIPLEPNKQAARDTLSITAGEKVLAVLPGSRRREVETLLPVFLQSATLLRNDIPQLKLLIPVPNKERKQQVEDYLSSQDIDNVQVVIGHSKDVMIASDAVLLASGTATLEAMLCKRPMVVAYLLKFMTYQMMRWLYKQRFFSLPNILAEEELVPELLQEAVNPANIASKLLPLLQQPPKDLNQRYKEMHQSLRLNADAQAAKAVSELVYGE